MTDWHRSASVLRGKKREWDLVRSGDWRTLMDKGMVGGGLVGKPWNWKGHWVEVGELHFGNSEQALGELRVGKSMGMEWEKGCVWGRSPGTMGNEKMW